MIDLCLGERVDAPKITGDLYDGDQTSMKTALFLVTRLRRLDEAGIHTFIVRGNHDAESRITRERVLPESVKVFGGYRENHRSSMMKNASAAFRTISRGAYSKLDSRLTDKGEILIGIPVGGGVKITLEMSKRTRFQLYLALRVAGYREFVDRHSPVPFIADDILKTFDNFRDEEAFCLFADMAKFGQVVYLSHHRHLCDIAQAVCPSVTVHALPGIPCRAGG